MWVLYAAIGLTIAFALTGVLIIYDTERMYPTEKKESKKGKDSKV